MKKLIGVLLFLSVFSLTACVDNTDPKIDDPNDKTVDCTVDPTDEDCVEETTLCTDQPDTCIVAVEELLADLSLAEKAAQMVQKMQQDVGVMQIKPFNGKILIFGGKLIKI